MFGAKAPDTVDIVLVNFSLFLFSMLCLYHVFFCPFKLTFIWKMNKALRISDRTYFLFCRTFCISCWYQERVLSVTAAFLMMSLHILFDTSPSTPFCDCFSLKDWLGIRVTNITNNYKLEGKIIKKKFTLFQSIMYSKLYHKVVIDV